VRKITAQDPDGFFVVRDKGFRNKAPSELFYFSSAEKSPNFVDLQVVK
jgi:hypothetical protein